MKNLKHLFTALLLLCATAVAAHDFEAGGIYYNIQSEEDKTVEVTYKGTSYYETDEYTGSVVIPQSVTYNGSTYSVTSIGGSAFESCSGLTSIEIPNSVTSIGSSAFYGCTGLTSIEIPNSITSIGACAFQSCSGLTSVEIPNSITSIGNSAFSGCSGLTSVEIPNSITSIGDWAFYRCTGLREVHIKDIAAWCRIDFASYDANPLYYAKNLYLNGELVTELVIPEGVKEIKNYAFYNCTGLTSIEIPNSVTSIGHHAFYNCSGLTSIEIPNSVTSIGHYAFSYCSGLTSVEIGNSVTSIGVYAFEYCSGFTSIEIPNSVTSIGDYAFCDCSGLTSVHISDLAAWCGISFGNYDANPLYHAKNLYLNGKKVTNLVIPNSVTSIGDYAFEYCSGLTSVEIPSSVTSIGYSAFEGCTGLTSIEIPSNIINLGTGVFRYCRFKTITIGAGVKDYCAALNGAYAEEIHITDLTSLFESYTNEGGWLHDAKLFLNGELITELVVPDGVRAINSFLFFGYSGLKSITIPNSVTSIGMYAFSKCTGLTSIEIGNSVTSIHQNAFSYCTGLTNVVIGNSVTSIGGAAFAGCSGLTSVTIGSGVKRIDGGAFNNCYNIRNVTSLIPAEELSAISPYSIGFGEWVTYSGTLYVPYGAKETYASTAGWNEFTNIVELEPTATEVTVTIGQYGSATYCSPCALDFSQVEGLKAYAATGYNKATQVVTLTRVQTTEAGVGLFLKGEPGEYVVPVIEYSNDYTLNLLVGTLEQTTVNSTDGAMSNYKFTIAEGDTAPMFYPFEDGTTLSGGKAYLQIPTVWLPATAQKSLSVRFDDGETTDIDELKGESGEVKTIYDLQGRVVENPTSGIYIINGKKVVVK